MSYYVPVGVTAAEIGAVNGGCPVEGAADLPVWEHILADVHDIAARLARLEERLGQLEEEFGPIARRYAALADTPAARFVRGRRKGGE